MSKLKISKELALPLDAITQTFSILAMRRKGKTYTASVMAEEFVAASLPFVALDPTGAWWGLRAAADGKSEGLPVVIIGGEHGDVPLEYTAGRVIADLVVDHPGFYVVDLSATESNSEQDRFATDFAERLYRRKNKARTPLHLFVDEADAFAPQRPMPGQQRMLGAFEALVRRGGIRGIGTTLITQRPAVLNKNVLTQTDSLIALQMNSPQDQDAIDDWVKRNGTKKERDTLMASLASLETGEAWFWSPGWLRTFEKIHVRERRTFNSSATPRAGEKMITPQKLAPVDIERLGKQIAETIHRANETDPAVLKRKVNDLQHKLDRMEEVARPAFKSPQQIEAEKPKIVEVSLLRPEHASLLDQIAEWMKEVSAKLGVTQDFVTQLASVRQDVLNSARLAKQASPIAPARPVIIRPVPAPPPRATHIESDGGVRLGKCERMILSVLARNTRGMTHAQLAVQAVYSCNSGGFNNALGKLRSLGYISRGHPILATNTGLEVSANHPETVLSGPSLTEAWLGNLGKCEREILKYLCSIHPQGAPAAIIGEMTNYSPSSGGFNNALGRLRTLELITRGQPITASDNLFQ